MAIIKTYPLKTSYFSQDRLVLSDMQPDSEGIVKGETKSLTLASLKNFIGSQVLDVSASTTDRYKGAFVSPSIGNVKVGIDLLPLTMLLAPNGFDYLLVTDDPSGNPINKKTTVDNFFSSVGLITNSSINYTVKLPSTVGGASQVLQLPSVIGSSPHQLEWSTPAGSGTVIGTGTTNYIPKWNSSSELTDSIVYESGANIGIGTTNPAFKLEVINTIGVSGTRPIRMNSATGAVDIRGSGTGGWANAFNFNGSANTVLGGFGCLGLGDGMNYWYIGSAYNNATMVIKPNNGNVGIGTTAPSQKLTVLGKGLFETGGSTPDPTVATYEKGITLTSGGAGNQRLVIDVSDVTNGGSYIQTRHQSTGFPTAEYVLALNPLGGNVGIGTSSPSDGDLTIGAPKLHVAAVGTSGTFNLAARFQSTTTDADNTGTSILINSSNDRGLLIKAGRKDGDREVAYFDVVNSIGNTTNMLTMGKFDSAFNVGIGTTTPTEKLDVTGNIKTSGRVYINGTANFIDTTRNASSQANYMRFYDSSTSSVEAYVGFTSNNRDFKIDSANASGTLSLKAGGGTVVYVNSSQNVGIGTTAPNAKLHVQDTSGSTSQIRISAASSNANYAFIKMEDVTANTSKLTLGATIGYAVEKPALSIFDSYTTLLGNGTSNGRLLFNCSANTHSVEIVGPDHSGGSSYSLKLPNSLPSVSNQILESNGAGALSWIPTPTGGGGSGGTVTSVGLSVPPAFSVSNSPITGSGSISLGISTSANPGEFLAYNGQWATPPDTGTIVVGNPSTGASAVLSGISIGSTIYSIPQGTGTGNIASVAGQNGLSGSGTSGNVVLNNTDRGSDQLFYSTIVTDNGSNVVATAGGTASLTLTGGTGMVTAGSTNKVSIALSQATSLLRGGLELGSDVGLSSINVAGSAGTGVNNRVYPLQLNGSGQAGVYVPWSSGASGISFSGTTVGGLATFSNSSTAAVSSKVNLNASGLMDFDYDGVSAASIDFDTNGTRLKIGDFNGEGAIVELFTDGSRAFQVGANGEIGVGTTASQGTLGQVLTSQGSGDPARWTNSGGNIANTNLTQTASRTYAMAQYPLTFTGTSTISMQNSNGLTVTNNISTNGQMWSARNSLGNKNTSFVIDWDDANVQEVDLTNAAGTNVIISLSAGTNVKPGARYSLIVSRLGYENSYGTYSFNGAFWPGDVTPANVTTGSNYWNLYEFVAAGPGLLGYAFRNYVTST